MASINDELVFKVRLECECCDRHQIDKPEKLETFIETETIANPNQSENKCGCNCRNEARRMCRELYGSIYLWQIDKELWKNITKEEIRRRKGIILNKDIDNNDENISNIKERINESLETQSHDQDNLVENYIDHENLVEELFNYIDKKFNL